MPDVNNRPTFQWTRDYAVGVDAIDREHQRLFAMTESMHQAMLAGRGKQHLTTLLNGLAEYTNNHFSHEERLMERVGYPDIGVHRRQHQELRAKVQNLQDRSLKGQLSMTIEVTQFLIGWLKGHTSTTDRQLGQYVNSGHGAAPKPGAPR